MVIRNITKSTTIAENISEAKKSEDKLFGMNYEKNSKGIILKTRFGIQTFLMKFAIDVLILDSKKRVVKISKNLKPNRILFWNPQFNTIVELPAGLVEKSRTEVGDTLNF